MKSLRPTFASLLLALSLVPGCKSSTADSDVDAGIGGSSGNGTDTGGSGGSSADTGGSSGDGTGGTSTLDDAGVATDSLAIAGTYDSSYGTVVTIADDTYSEDGEFGYENEIVVFDNEEQFFVTLDETATAGAQYSKYAWVESDGLVYICTTLFAQETVQDASGEDDSDREDLEGGCGGSFAWTVLTPSSGDGPDAG